MAARPQRLAVVVEDRDRLLAIHLCDGWRETLAVAREQLGLGPGLRVYVTTAANVLCRWRHGEAPAACVARSRARRAA